MKNTCVKFKNQNLIDNICLTEECSDYDRDTIYKELQLYIPDIIKDNLEYKWGYYHLRKENIWFSGDNLVTRKQMFRRFKGNKSLKKADNDKEFVSYIILPFIKGKPDSSVNKKRNSLSSYNDNPFVFFEALKAMYLKEFKKYDDNLEKSLSLTKNYWNLFGEKEEGYNNFVNRFGLNCLKELKEKVKFNQFFKKDISEYCWGDYEELLCEFKKKRKEELGKLLEARWNVT